MTVYKNRDCVRKVMEGGGEDSVKAMSVRCSMERPKIDVKNGKKNRDKRERANYEDRKCRCAMVM